MRTSFSATTMAVVASLALACGNSASIADTAAPDAAVVDDGGKDSDALSTPPPVPISPIDDAGADGDSAAEDAGCGARPGTSASCVITDLCTADCASQSWVYECVGSGARPPIDGCVARGPDGGNETWCCPPKCVPSAPHNSDCGGGTAWTCPSGPGVPGTTPPAPDCVFRFPSTASNIYCCP